jgi:hypothetical protein
MVRTKRLKQLRTPTSNSGMTSSLSQPSIFTNSIIKPSSKSKNPKKYAYDYSPPGKVTTMNQNPHPSCQNTANVHNQTTERVFAMLQMNQNIISKYNQLKDNMSWTMSSLKPSQIGIGTAEKENQIIDFYQRDHHNGPKGRLRGWV